MTHVQLSLHDLSQLVVMQTQSGKSRKEIVNILVTRGWPEKSATRFVDMTLSEHEELASRVQADTPEKDDSSSNNAFPSELEMWRMLYIVALAIAIIVLFSLMHY